MTHGYKLWTYILMQPEPQLKLRQKLLSLTSRALLYSGGEGLVTLLQLCHGTGFAGTWETDSLNLLFVTMSEISML